MTGPVLHVWTCVVEEVLRLLEAEGLPWAAVQMPRRSTNLPGVVDCGGEQRGAVLP